MRNVNNNNNNNNNSNNSDNLVTICKCYFSKTKSNNSIVRNDGVLDPDKNNYQICTTTGSPSNLSYT